MSSLAKCILISFFAVLLLGWGVLPKRDINPSGGQLERKNSEIIKGSGMIILQGNTLKASVVPVILKPQVFGILFNNEGSKKTWNKDIAIAIMKAESSEKSDAINWKDYHKTGNCWGSFGLFQLACIHIGKYGLTRENILDPETNINAAYQLWKERGWQPWAVYESGRYKKFLD